MKRKRKSSAAVQRKTLLGRLRSFGPGLITGASDDDPSGIATYSVAGASTGLSMLWLALFTTPMMAVIEGMCARIGIITGRGLGANIRKSVPRPIAYILALAVVAANTFNVGADFSGMGAAANLVVPAILTPTWVVIFALTLLLGIMFLSYRRISDIFKWLTTALFAYVATAIIVRPHWGDVLRSLVIPHVQLNRQWMTTFVGVIGTTISPYLFFWQASLEVEEENSPDHIAEHTTKAELADAHFDVNVGMVFSNLVMAFIIITTGLTLYAHGHRNIATAQDAARALEPLAGHLASLLFMLGIVGTGILAIPALAGSSAYAVGELFGFPVQGLNEPPSKAKHFYAVFGLGLVAGMAMVFARVDPIKALYYSAVINGIVAVPLVFVIVRLASDRKVMGRFTSSPLARAWGWITFVVMGVAAAAIFI